jgi:hypothetical protein
MNVEETTLSSSTTTSTIKCKKSKSQETLISLESELDNLDLYIDISKKYNLSPQLITDLETKKRRLSTLLFEEYIYGEGENT